MDNRNFIFITGDISFQDVKEERVSYVEVYRAQMQNWLFHPARHLATMVRQPVYPLQPNTYEHGIALMILLMTFFEPHGHFRQGRRTRSRAGDTFRAGMEPFLAYLRDKRVIDEEITANFLYRNARNGLMHTGYLDKPLLVDIRASHELVVYKNPIIENSWLANPWAMLEHLEVYFEEYLSQIETPRTPEEEQLKENFVDAFERYYVHI